MYKLDKESILKNLNTDLKKGLSSTQIEENREQYGKNQLEEDKKISLVTLFFNQLKDVMIYVLLIAAVITIIIHWPHGFGESSIILAVVLINAVIGVLQEYKAGKVLSSLKKMSSPKIIVIRNSKEEEINVEDLVVGDIIILETGKYIPADIRLLEASNLQVDESALTGESIPVLKDASYETNQDQDLGDRKNMAYMSTLITSGKAKAVVVAVGMDTEIGKIAKIILNTEETDTPLQKKLNSLGKTLGYIAIGICIIIFILGVLQGKPIIDVLIVSISLAVAAVPEGLVAIVAIVLTFGITRMSKRNAIVKKLHAVETLGSVNVVCSDKTGTLTQNKMTVVDQYFVSGDEINNQVMYLCSDVIYDENNNSFGDPTEIAIVDYVKNRVDVSKYKENKRVDENPFDSDRKLMSTINKNGSQYRVYVKGALESLLEVVKYIEEDGKIRDITEEDINNIHNKANEMSDKALRVLAFGYKDEVNLIPNKDLEKNLIFTGLVGMIDPPRESAKESVRLTKKAGIKVVMITGDHKNTAFAIAKDLEIAEDISQAITGKEIDQMTEEEFNKNIEKYSVFARVSPEHKVRIIKALKNKGKIVSMTGDGVNDAPSLKMADIGVAMGITGTDVAKSASSMILLDDNFSTIINAIETGRNIYNNIKKTIIFLLTCNLGEVVTILLATLLKWPLPLVATQILWVNLVTDTLPALALGVDPGDKDVMNEKPRSMNDNFFSNGVGYKAFFIGILIGLLTLLSFYAGIKGRGYTVATAPENVINYARTMAFTVLTFSQLFYALTMRSEKKTFGQINFFSNKYLLGAILIGVVIQLVLIYLPIKALHSVFYITSVSFFDFDIIILASIIPTLASEVLKIFSRKN